MNNIDVQVRMINFPASGNEAVAPNEDGSYTIFINSRLSDSGRKKAYRHAMNHIQDNDFEKNEVQGIEKHAHEKSFRDFNEKVGLIGLIKSFEDGCRESHEVAERLNVTEEFLLRVIEYYRRKYGICTTVDSYVIYFIPHLMVGKII